MSAPEFSRLVDPRKLPAELVQLEANSSERSAMAKRFGLVSVERLTAEVELAPHEDAVLAKGRLNAEIVQSCAVSGDDLPTTIEEALDLRFVPAREIEEEELELEEEDLDEIAYEGDKFDLGEAVAQSLALAIDPYATGPNAEKVRGEAGLTEEAASGPLADALRALKGD